MRVRLTQLDGALPNLALMRLAALHRGRGDEVRFTRSPYQQLDEPDYDRVYGSAIFSFSAGRVERLRQSFPGAIIGGSWNPDDLITVEAVEPGAGDALDYTDYPTFAPSIGFTQRGCRFKCGFCSVPQREGRPKPVNTITDIWRGPGHLRHLHLLDNDFFGQPKPEWQARLQEIRDGQFRVCFNQGLNIRVITDEIAAELVSVKYMDDSFGRRRLYTAFDDLGDERRFFRGVATLERAGIPASHLFVYMLVGYAMAETWGHLLYRFDRMFERGMLAYPMVYGDKNRTLPLGDAHPRIEQRRLTLGDFQRWAVRSSKIKVKFHEYDRAAKGWSAKQANLFEHNGAGL